ncbi:MAG: nucleotidyl transferase AbiEii/AbiGii toxin family protein [Planctomycetes bacterium]|nr:nucleotidyl transferase AbiEii/AbiGii toxin family protein [Planctomycetota bacterium]
MALTEFQLAVCRLIAHRRMAEGESYVAGGAALNALAAAPRVSRDIDLFHDTADAVESSFEGDRALLIAAGYAVQTTRDRRTFVEAVVARGAESVVLQWTSDSAYRFFPLIEHPDFGLALHPFDLATNKVLALVGRLEPRDWVDVITCHDRIQPLGYLAWAACGKDPGFSPSGILAHAGRSSRYTDIELAPLEFEGTPPTAADLSRRWHAMLDEARDLVRLLPAEHAGRCVLASDLTLFRGDGAALERALRGGAIRFHAGSIRGAWPQIRDG